MYDHTRISLIFVAMKMSGHCCIVIVFDVNDVTLESIHDSVFGLPYIFYMAPVAFQTVYKIVTLACAFGNCIVGCIIVQVFIFPDSEILAQYLQVLGLLQPL